MSMIIGELDYDELFHQQEGEEEIAFPEVSFLLWVTFLILMPILLSNLLVSCYIFCWQLYREFSIALLDSTLDLLV